MNNVDNNIKSIPKLLRAMAASELHRKNKHDVIFLEAANLIEHLAKIRKISQKLVEEHKLENS